MLLLDLLYTPPPGVHHSHVALRQRKPLFGGAAVPEGSFAQVSLNTSATRVPISHVSLGFRVPLISRTAYSFGVQQISLDLARIRKDRLRRREERLE